MSAEKFREFLENIQNKWNNLKNNNEIPDYLEKLRPLLDKHEYEITNIAMLGIGNPPNLHHLNMLLALRDYFRRDVDIKILCQEQLAPIPKKYKDFMASKNIDVFSSNEKDPHLPIAEQITSTTLVFAPNAGPFAMKAMKTAPELYIGVSMERQEAACLAMGAIHKSARIDAEVIHKHQCDCAEVPKFLSASYTTDVNPLVLYRRTEGALNGRGANQEWKNTAPHWTRPYVCPLL